MRLRIHGGEAGGREVEGGSPLCVLDGMIPLLESLTEAGTDGLDKEGLQTYMYRCSLVINRLEYLSGRALADLDRATARGTISWMKNALKMCGGAAAERLLTANELEAHPRTAALACSGEISYEQAAIVARSISEVSAEDADTVETRLIPGLGLEPGRFRHFANGVVAEVDTDRLRQSSQRAWEKRGLHLGPDRDGVASIRGHLTSEAFAHWMASVEAFLKPSGTDDDRSSDQRMHDAVLQVMKGATATAPGSGRRPQVVITAPLSVFTGEGGPPPLLQGLIPISREELDQFICEGDLTMLLQDAKGNIAFQARRARLFSPAKRRGIIATHPTCSEEGCGRPATLCDIHHVDEVNQGGESTVDKGAPYCWEHHPKFHREGWAAIPNGDGTFRAVPPGHPDHPGVGLSPEEYTRRRLRAIAERKKGRRGPNSAPGPAPPSS